MFQQIPSTGHTSLVSFFRNTAEESQLNQQIWSEQFHQKSLRSNCPKRRRHHLESSQWLKVLVLFVWDHHEKPEKSSQLLITVAKSIQAHFVQIVRVAISMVAFGCMILAKSVLNLLEHILLAVCHLFATIAIKYNKILLKKTKKMFYNSNIASLPSK